MKVLQINAFYGSGSTGRTAMELDHALQKAGHESIIATAHTSYDQSNLYIIGNRTDWKIHSLLSRVIGKQGYFSVQTTRKLLSYIEQEKPDVIHLRNLHANYIHVPMLLKYIIKHKIPTVITLHDCWFFTGKCCYYTDDGCNRWKEECGQCPALRKWNKSWFFDRSSEMLAEKRKLLTAIPRLAVVGVSDWITSEAKESILKDAWRVRRIYNWIDLDVFKPHNTSDLREKMHLQNTFVVIGVASAWSMEKGITIFQKIAENMPDIKVVLIGKLSDQFKMPDNVYSVGEVSDTKKLAEYYSMADVMVNPSVQETFGKTTAEAMASGTPVIGYNFTATPELIGSGCGEIIEKKDDIDSFIQSVETVRKNGKGFYTERCRRFAEDNFDKDILIQEYIEMYREMIDEKY